MLAFTYYGIIRVYFLCSNLNYQSGRPVHKKERDIKHGAWQGHGGRVVGPMPPPTDLSVQGRRYNSMDNG